MNEQLEHPTLTMLRSYRDDIRAALSEGFDADRALALLKYLDVELTEHVVQWELQEEAQ